MPGEAEKKEDNQSDHSSESDIQEYGVYLHHLDRIFIGMNTLFLFKYPMMKVKTDEILSERASIVGNQ